MPQSKLSKIPDGVTEAMSRPIKLPDSDEMPKNYVPYKIYLLKRIFSLGDDEYVGKVIVASSAKAARKMANLKYGDEGTIWTDANQVLCREIPLTMPLIVLESFNAG